MDPRQTYACECAFKATPERSAIEEYKSGWIIVFVLFGVIIIIVAESKEDDWSCGFQRCRGEGSTKKVYEHCSIGHS